MNIELKHIRVDERFSQETLMYSASLLVDGVHWADVGNDGHGGPDHYYPVEGRTMTDLRTLNDYLKATNPSKELEVVDKTIVLDYDLEMYCADFIERDRTTKQFQHLAKRYVVFVKEGKVFQAKLPKGSTVETTTARLLIQEPNALVLNSLPLEEAVALFQKHI